MKFSHSPVRPHRIGVANRARRTLLACTGAVALTITVHGAALAMECASEKQRASFDVRVLQSKLMVAALICGVRDEYNEFVLRYRPALQRHGRTLVAYFNDTFENKSRRQLDRFVTDLANEASRESNIDRQRFCGEARRVLSRLDGQITTRLDPRAYDGFVNGSPATEAVCRYASR